MSLVAFSAITVASAVNSAVPGPCVVLTLGRAARSGVFSGFSVTIGLAVANLILCVVALSITQGVLAFSAQAHAWMKWIGISALIATALFMLLHRTKMNIALHDRSPGGRVASDLAAGVVIGLSSPINLVFFLSLMPQFLPSQGLTIVSTLWISGAVVSGAFATYAGASFIGAMSGGVRPGVGRRIECFGAALLVGFAILAATSSMRP